MLCGENSHDPLHFAYPIATLDRLKAAEQGALMT